MSVEHLPAYRSHKIVRAGAFIRVEQAEHHPGKVRLVLRIPGDEAGGTTDIFADQSVFARGIPRVGDYIVVYEGDGYVSWSPKAVFEAGYTRVAGAETAA